jgi:diacylglycerol kinase (ATP)
LAKQNQNFSIRKRAKSFRYALEGLKVLVSEEHNSRIHFVVSLLAMAAAFYFKISGLEWVALILCIGFVFALEIINSAIENLADFVEPNRHEAIKKIKDLAAASVLVGSITAASVGLIVFIPKILNALS